MTIFKKAHALDLKTELRLNGFRAYQLNSKSSDQSCDREDFYKISLYTGKYIFQYADRSFKTEETILFFGSPRITHSCEIISQIEGYACFFTEDFFKISEQYTSLLHAALFKIGNHPILQLNSDQKASITTIYQKIIIEQKADYTFKHELIRDYISLIIHEALKMMPF